MGSGALAGSSGVGLTSPAFSGKFTGGMLLSGSPRGSHSPHGAGVQLPSRGHSRSSSMQMNHGPSPLSAGLSRRASDGADALAAGEASLAAKRSSSSSALHHAAAMGAAAEPASVADALPLSTQRLESEGSGFVLGPGASGKVQVLPPPSSSSTPTVAARASTPQDATTAEELESLQPEELKKRVLDAEGEVREWRAAIDTANARITELYDETHHLQSLYQITERDAKYLREVLVSALKSGELNATASMLQGLSRMLHFTPNELEKIQSHSRSGGGVVGSLAGWGFSGLTSPSPTTGGRYS